MEQIKNVTFDSLLVSELPNATYSPKNQINMFDTPSKVNKCTPHKNATPSKSSIKGSPSNSKPNSKPNTPAGGTKPISTLASCSLPLASTSKKETGAQRAAIEKEWG